MASEKGTLKQSFKSQIPEFRSLLNVAGDVGERFMEMGNSSLENRDRGKLRGSPPPTPPDMRVRIRRFGGLSNRFHS
jgi:hypothetical protein